MVKYEHKIGITKDTPVENYVAGNFEGETNEVGIYLAMSRQASREGYGELAEVFKRLAWEEAEHAARFCEMNGIIKPTLKENIEWMMGGEKMANAEKREASESAQNCAQSAFSSGNVNTATNDQKADMAQSDANTEEFIVEFRVKTTRAKLKALRDFMRANGIRPERI